MARQPLKSLRLVSARQQSTSMATISQLLHHPLLAPACLAAPTATPQAPPLRSQITARPARTQPAAVHVSATASREAGTGSSLTVVAPVAATATTHHPAVLPMEKSMAPVAHVEMGSWSDDEELIYLGWKGVEKRNTRAVHSLRLFLFAHDPAPSWFLGARPTRSRIRGPAVTMFMSCCAILLFDYDRTFYALRDVERTGRGWILQRAVWMDLGDTVHGGPQCLVAKDGPDSRASHILALMQSDTFTALHSTWIDDF